MSVRLKNNIHLQGPDEATEGSSPTMDRKKQFATVALAKTRQNRRPSTVKLFSNGANPFAEAGPSPGNSSKNTPAPVARPVQRDDSTLRKSTMADTDTSNDKGAFENNTEDEPVGLVNQYRFHEPQYMKQWSALQPFQFGNSSDVAVAKNGFPPRKVGYDERMNPQEWEKKVATYNDWELGMLHKLALVAEVLLTPDSLRQDPKKLDERLDEIASQDSSERAKPVRKAPPPVATDQLEVHDNEHSDVTGTPSSRRRSPRSPEASRKQPQKYGSWSAKVAAAKKKSWERKKGGAPDTLTQLRMEEGVEVTVKEEPDKSLFTIWNKDGTAATSSPTSLSGTPTGSPVVTRKSQSNNNAESGSSSKPQTPTITRKNRFSSIRGKRMSVNLSSPPKEDEGTPAFPGLSMRSADAAAFQQLKRENEALSEQPAFPGMSLRSSDAAAFQELLKMDKEKKELEASSSNISVSGGGESKATRASSPTSGSSPTTTIAPPAAVVGVPGSPEDSQNSTPTLSKRGSERRKPELGLKLSFVGQGRRGSSKDAGVHSDPSSGTASGTGTPQRSPKANKRFSTVFSRQPLSPKGSDMSQSSGSLPKSMGTPQSPRFVKSGDRGSKMKSPSPRSSQGLKVPAFGKRKTGTSPRQFEDNPNAVSPPLSARELLVDGSTLAALDDFVGGGIEEEEE